MWFNKCTITKKTGCPDPSWLHAHYTLLGGAKDFFAVNIGCNKGFDAIQYLRMGTNNASISKSQWREYMPADMQPGVCGQERDERELSSSHSSSAAAVQSNARVVCVEPLTNTYAALASAAAHYPGQFDVLQYAVNNEPPGTALFPKATSGAEKEGTGNCYSKRPARQARLRELCEPIPTTKLDLLMQQPDYQGRDVHILLIDVEGWDYEVLKGGVETLRRTHYLEFEYNWRGQWWDQKEEQPLLEAVTLLDNMDFTCYWAGQRQLWQLTGCWLPHYNGLFWSNVVCVNRVLSPILAQTMSDLFLETISV